MSSIVHFLTDPTALFVYGCLAIGPILAAMNNPDTAVEETVNYMKDPAMLAGIGALLVTALLCKSVSNLSSSNRRIALWFLFNGAFIHITMDGMTGGWHFLKLLDNHYRILDQRFNTDETTSWLITQLELFIMAPLCLLTYRAYTSDSSSKHPLVILTSTFQLIGAIFFFFTEVINDFVNVPIDRNLEFTFDHLLYFWFGYGANLIWIVIPVYLIWDAHFRVVNHVDQRRRLSTSKKVK